MDVARHQLARGAGVAVGHRDHDGFLEGQHVAHLRCRGEGVHDRQLGRAGIAEQMGHALACEKLQKCLPAIEICHRSSWLLAGAGASGAPSVMSCRAGVWVLDVRFSLVAMLLQPRTARCRLALAHEHVELEAGAREIEIAESYR